MTADEIRDIALEEFWRSGNAWRVIGDRGIDGRSGQVEWIERFLSTPGHAVWLISRQRGKSFAALLYAVCLCIARPGTIVRYAAKTKESAWLILEPTLQQILETCPDDLKPKLDSPVKFPNGSEISWAGTDAQSFDRLRGPRSHLILFDECAFYQDLEKVEAALLPQLITTRGKAIYLSTPPESPVHVFASRYRAALGTRRATRETIHDNPRLDVESLRLIAQAEADRLNLSLEELYSSTFWRREYLAEIVTESSRAALPAWEQHGEKCIGVVERPAHFDGYVTVDFGFLPDPSAILAGWHDFPGAKLIITHEWERWGATTKQVIEAAKAIETEAWGSERWDGTLTGAADFSLEALPLWLRDGVHKKAPRQPYLRSADGPKQTLAEISTEQGYALLPARKAEKRLAVDTLNNLVREERLIVDPSCVRTIEQLSTTLWNNTRTEWERSSKHDHGDLLDDAIYMAREVRWNRDPRPVPEPTDAAWKPKPRGSPFAALLGPRR